MISPQTIFCVKCESVRSYPFATPGQPYAPPEFVHRGLCDACLPWEHEISEAAQGLRDYGVLSYD